MKFKLPDGFIPDGFTPDPPPPRPVPTSPVVQSVVTQSSNLPLQNSFQSEIQQIIDSIPLSGQTFPPILLEAISAIQNQSSVGGIEAWFKKHGSSQRAELYRNQGTEMLNLVALMDSQTSAWVSQVKRAFAPVRVRLELEKEVAQHEVTKETISYQLGLILISQAIAKLALSQGKTPELYLAELTLKVARDNKIAEAKELSNIKIEEDEALKINARNDENLSAINKIERATDAKNAKLNQLKQCHAELARLIIEESSLAADGSLREPYRSKLLKSNTDHQADIQEQIDELLGRTRKADSGQNS